MWSSLVKPVKVEMDIDAKSGQKVPGPGFLHRVGNRHWQMPNGIDSRGSRKLSQDYHFLTLGKTVYCRNMSYFQLGGYNGHIASLKSRYDEKDLANTIAGPSSPLRSAQGPSEPINLILGIKISGTSHLLLTENQVNQFNRSRGSSSLNVRGNPFRARDFESLSPISFDTVEELAKKMTALKPKAGKGREDNSKANWIYKDIEIYRGAFEHGRVLYGILSDTIKNHEIYGCYDASWAHNISVSSFIFNVMAVDDRNKEERIKNPHILDVGLCSAVLPSLTADETTAHHIVNRNNAFLGGKRTDFSHGDSQKVDGKAVEDLLNDFFKKFKHRTSTPTVLLIFDEELTRGYLRKINVDTSSWSFNDLKDLVFQASPNVRGSQGSHYDNRDRSGRGRSRSRSPIRHPRAQYHSPFQSNRNSRHPTDHPPTPSYSQSRADEQTKLYSPVYVVDIQQLYNKLMRNDQAKSFRKVAEHILGVNILGMCAGNEATLAIEVWKAMISGPSIDEQRELRLTGADDAPTKSSNSGPSNMQSHHPGGDSDEEDPNEYVAPKQGPSKPATQQKSFSDSDYGDSDSD